MFQPDCPHRQISVYSVGQGVDIFNSPHRGTVMTCQQLLHLKNSEVQEFSLLSPFLSLLLPFTLHLSCIFHCSAFSSTTSLGVNVFWTCQPEVDGSSDTTSAGPSYMHWITGVITTSFGASVILLVTGVNTSSARVRAIHFHSCNHCSWDFSRNEILFTVVKACFTKPWQLLQWQQIFGRQKRQWQWLCKHTSMATESHDW